MNQDSLNFFAKYIEKELGIVYSEASYFQLEYRLNQLCKELGYPTIQELQEAAKSGLSVTAKERVLDIATNNETSFFRDPSVFKALSSVVFPRLAEMKPYGQLRVWSAACSSGQEAYSVAIEYDQFCQSRGITKSAPSISFLLSDISGQILQKAKSATYSKLEVQRGLPDHYLQKYFDQLGDDSFQVKSFLRNEMQFKRLNLLESFLGIGQFDIILCRNVLIYQNIENKKLVLEKLKSCLLPDGVMFLGAAESLLGLSNDFDQETHQGAIFFSLTKKQQKIGA